MDMKGKMEEEMDMKVLYDFFFFFFFKCWKLKETLQASVLKETLQASVLKETLQKGGGEIKMYAIIISPSLAGRENSSQNTTNRIKRLVEEWQVPVKETS